MIFAGFDVTREPIPVRDRSTTTCRIPPITRRSCPDRSVDPYAVRRG